jgi:mono/diheme cytochrome c family protein
MSATHAVRMMFLKLAIAGAVGSTAGVAMAADEAEDTKSPMETAETAEKGTLKNPYQPSDGDVAAEGKEIYMAAGCNGCHGGTGGGGMGPPLTNPIWIYGNDDDTLFRLIALGSDKFMEQGYTRKGSEAVVGPMPAQGTIIKSNDDMWKMITWIHSLNQ